MRDLAPVVICALQVEDYFNHNNNSQNDKQN